MRMLRMHAYDVQVQAQEQAHLCVHASQAMRTACAAASLTNRARQGMQDVKEQEQEHMCAHAIHAHRMYSCERYMVVAGIQHVVAGVHARLAPMHGWNHACTSRGKHAHLRHAQAGIHMHSMHGWNYAHRVTCTHLRHTQAGTRPHLLCPVRHCLEDVAQQAHEAAVAPHASLARGVQLLHCGQHLLEARVAAAPPLGPSAAQRRGRMPSGSDRVVDRFRCERGRRHQSETGKREEMNLQCLQQRSGC